MHFEDGFHFHSLPSLSGETKALIVIFHGHGSHPDKYLKWAKKTQDENPAADVLVIRAPVPMKATAEYKASRLLPDVDDLYTWHGVEEKARKKVGLMVRHVFNRLTVVHKLNRLIDSQLEKRDLNDDNLALIGFSMGGAVAVQVSQRRKKECAAVVCHSGVVLPFTKARKKPETLMIMGDKDDLFFLQKVSQKKPSRLSRAFRKVKVGLNLHHDRSVKRLKKSGVPVTEQIFKGQDHRVTEDSWQAATAFVKSRLKLKK